MKRRAIVRAALRLAILAGAAAVIAFAVRRVGPFTLAGGRYELLAPRMLLALAALPVLAWVATASLADLPRPQRWLSFAARTLLFVLLALALARLARSGTSRRVATVFLVDVSDSVSDPGLAAARGWLEGALRERVGGSTFARVVTFAIRPRVVPMPSSGGAPTIARHAGAGAGTHVAAALQLAYGLFPPGTLRRVVILSDGNETAGIRPPELAVPLATFTGWNPRHPEQGAPGDLMQMMGSTFAFARTRAEREGSGDPRLSIAERYPSRAAYLERVREAAQKLAAARHVLDEDIEASVERAGRQWDFLHA